MSDHQATELIHGDRIDLLVDLTMHMEKGRPLLFARKPAPLQVCWLAYPGTTGLSAMDYRLTDPYLDPPTHDPLYVEKSIRLPRTFWCYDPLTEVPAINELPALQNGYVTFGCLNHIRKISDDSLHLWTNVLRQLPTARIIVLAPEGRERERLLRKMGAAGQAMEFVEPCPRSRYLKLYHRMDLCLDAVPYNGHTTSLDAYWMGVPVVTVAGETAVSRAGLSQLTNLRLEELVAGSAEEYVRIAVGLARDTEKLRELRATLRERMRNSPLMDGPAFARGMEDAFRQMWREWCDSAT